MLIRASQKSLSLAREGDVQPGQIAEHHAQAGPINSTLAWRRPLRGVMGAPCMIIFDPPPAEAMKAGLPATMDVMTLFARLTKSAGMVKEDFFYAGLCPSIHPEDIHSASRKWKHVQHYLESLHDLIAEARPRCIVTVGELASRAVLGRAVAITKARGIPIIREGGGIVYPILSPGFVMRLPEHMPTFEADITTLGKLRAGDWRAEAAASKIATRYEWREDISDVLANRPALLAIDTETTGLDRHNPATRVLTVQFSYEPGHAIVCPIHEGYWPAWRENPQGLARLRGQLRDLLGDSRIRKIGHNPKFDDQMLYMREEMPIEGLTDDTQLMAFGVDEDMMRKDLDECVRRWVPDMAGYADEFNATTDKSKMIEVPHEKMLPYAGGDPDATLRLFLKLDPILRADARQHAVYRRIHMPAIQTFSRVVERFGMLIDKDRLRALHAEVQAWTDAEYRELIRMVPAAIRRRHLSAGKKLEFSRPEFLRDALFDQHGFGLKPVVFTKSTAQLEDESKREASTSTKDHLPFFTERDDAAGEFCRRIIEFQKAQKLSGTYIGTEAEGNGFWQYITPQSRIYPSYALHKTNTGRTASSNPNGQNFPKRGRFAKPYQGIFLPTPGFKLVNCDLSQIELRLAAWVSGDPTMLEVYRRGGDIHAATAMATMQIGDNEWAMLTPEARKLARFRAKAVNFGFVYGMGWRGFRTYAKTQYGVNYTEREAQQTRERYFATYSRLPAWHEAMKSFVGKHGYVRALHGAMRHLPSIRSRDDGIKAMAERQAINAPIQRFGSDLGVIAMTRFSRQANPDLMRIIGFVHDALVMEVRDGHEEEGINALLYAMEDVSPLRDWFGLTPPLPIKAEADIGINGKEMLEFADLPPVEKRPEWFVNLGFDRVQAERPHWWSDAVDRRAEEDFQRLYADEAAGENLLHIRLGA